MENEVLGGVPMSERQKEILKMIVQEYIHLAKPVSSKEICDELGCSSATVRNDMAALEDLGYLEKTHTSSGRIPSEKGYRYYVDHLMEPKKITGEDMLKLQMIFHNQALELSDCIKQSLMVISEMTSYTSVVLGKASHENKLKEINVVPLNDNSLIVLVITDQGHVEHKTVELSNVSLEDVKKTVNLINDLIVGTPIDEVSGKLEFEIKPIISRYVKEHELLYNVFYRVFREFQSKNVDVVGKDNILKQPEFNNVQKIRELFSKLNEEELESKIVADKNDISIYIGRETKIDSDVAVVQTSYKTAKEEGTIAIIGPKRMEYDRVVELLDYMKKHIEKETEE